MSVTVERLAKRFTESGTPAVSGASFSAPDGAITSLLGPSGSGKTTVLRMIAGLEEPDDGTVRIGDVDCTRVPVRQRAVGFVFQGYALFQNMSVRENIGFGLHIRRAPRKEVEARVDELIELVQLQAMADRLPAQLSGGQQQRVAFARALAPKPRVLLLDEPFGALDAKVRVELREWLRDLHERTHVTTVLVTHDQEEALELSQHVVLMHDGEVVQAGSPHQLYDHPANAFVASFLGSANVLHGKVEQGRAEIGSVSMAAPAGSRDGASVEAYVRPHDIKLARFVDGQPEPGAPGGSGLPATRDVSLAQVVRATRIGGFVKLELRLPSGELMTVQVPKPEADALGAAVGDRVMVDLGRAQVFVEDYSI